MRENSNDLLKLFFLNSKPILKEKKRRKRRGVIDSRISGIGLQGQQAEDTNRGREERERVEETGKETERDETEYMVPKPD